MIANHFLPDSSTSENVWKMAATLAAARSSPLIWWKQEIEK